MSAHPPSPSSSSTGHPVTFTRVPGAQPPVEEPGVRQTRRKKTAAGYKAIEDSIRFGVGMAGTKNTLMTFPNLNQVKGFNCQSCAWPNPDDDRSIAEFCENGFKAVSYEADTRRLTPKFFREHSIADLAARSDHWLGEQGRLTEPLVRRPGSTHYEPVTWNEVFQLMATELKALDSPHQAIFYTSGRTSNETAFLYQLFARAFGTNNLPDCSNMCHESTSVAMPPMLGIGKACVKLQDVETADAIFILGQNPGTNHPRMMTALQKMKEAGGKLVFVNPLPETGAFRFKNPQDLLHPTRIPRFLFGRGTELSDMWLPVRINGDMAFLKGLMKDMLEHEDAHPGSVFDHDFIRLHTEGYEELIEVLRATSWDDILHSSGLSRQQIREASAIAMQARSTVVCWCMGLTQHKNAVATIQDIINFLFLRGNIGRPGAGPCPVRGHSNVQGDRTMGIWDKADGDFLDKLATEFNIDPPREDGYDTVAAVKAMHDGSAKFFFAMGGNFLSSPSDTEYTAAALQNCRLTAHVSIKLNRSHLITGQTALILPCLGRTEIDRQAGGEQFQTNEDTMGVVNPTRGVIEPASPHLLSESAIVAGLAKATLGVSTPIDWDAYVADYDLIRDKIEATIPGFPSFNARIREGTFYLPNPPRDERRFETPSGKAVFKAHPLTRCDVPPGHLLLTTIRSHDQFNTTIYRNDDRYRGIFNGRRVIFMNEDDLHDLNLVQGQMVDITSHFKGEQRHAEKFMVAPYPIPKGCAAAYYPETNVLVPLDSTADESNTPTSKSIIITVHSPAEQFLSNGAVPR
ncbi:FdhF/YdeP family oxidoreductase [Phragmitibacter flavus]|uniref:FdhF/YdeP family oxidoreductase n=1 Tax=Phragmitibacter flavus TaxID=2576071 RepID=A0A5R8KGE1_9BACT|nr:FdhF/YdeP family oxidoreductase [Phragmitibacter flavus]TLD71366.1 FdhF/YdeP family oxidoreductase [Phragmitibacter flavus]